jgi:hypothetical protein
MDISKTLNEIREKSDRPLMRKIEDFILSTDLKTLEHFEDMIELRKKQLKTTSKSNLTLQHPISRG